MEPTYPCDNQFTAVEQTGSLATAICSVISFIAIVPIFIRLWFQAMHNARATPAQRRLIFKTQLDVYMASLLVSDLVQAVGGMLTFHWVVRGGAQCGTMCDVQGFLKSIGDPGVSMTTMVITIHTFLVIAMSWTPDRSLRIPISVVSLTWTFRLSFVIAGKLAEDPGKPFMTPTPYYCWISDYYNAQRIPAAHLWHWLSTGLSIVLYTSLFFIIRRRTLTPVIGHWRSASDFTFVRIGGVDIVAQSRKMLCYPLANIVVIVPFSVFRIMDFCGKKLVDPRWYFLSICLFNLGGLANVLLLIFLRPYVLGFYSEEATTYPERRPIGRQAMRN